jgi:hypothetical protein
MKAISSPASGTLEFEINGLLNVDCDSYECDGFASWELGLAAISPITGPFGIVPALGKLVGRSLFEGTLGSARRPDLRQHAREAERRKQPKALNEKQKKMVV